MPRRVLLIQGHPDATVRHLCHALAEAYSDGAGEGGHDVRLVEVARLEFPLLRSPLDWKDGALPEGLVEAQESLGWAEHVVLFFPLWLGGMPALLKGFLEQVARPGFAFSYDTSPGVPRKLLTGRSARIVATMGMPALVYRWYFRAHSVKALERNILGFVGIAPIHETLIGSVEGLDAAAKQKWFQRLRDLGRKAA